MTRSRRLPGGKRHRIKPGADPVWIDADDLKETKDRLSSEIEGLHKMLARKERNQEEALGRARVAEGALATLQTTHKSETAAARSKIKDLEQGYSQADEVSSTLNL